MTTFTDHRGEALAVGDHVIPIGWGDGIPLWLSNSRATVVGFGRTRVHLRFESCAYFEGDRPHAAVPTHLRRLGGAA